MIKYQLKLKDFVFKKKVFVNRLRLLIWCMKKKTTYVSIL